VSGFAATWLALREPYDHAARSAELATRFTTALGASPYLLDLGCGTGSNLRYLAPRIPGAQRWLCIDHDPALLQGAQAASQAWASGQGWPASRNGAGLDIARPGGEFRIGFAARDLACAGLPDLRGVAGLTASALLDLTSAAWLDDLAARCGGTPLLAALSFDGRLLFEPAAEEDAEIRRRFIAHQQTDKGFGPALGPDAATHLADRLAAAGCLVSVARSDWRLGRDDGDLLRASLAGIVAAAREIPEDACLERWATLRSQQQAAGELRLTVGHVDLLALPG
jgi:SAM-dependent methyltransferase